MRLSSGHTGLKEGFSVPAACVQSFSETHRCLTIYVIYSLTSSSPHSVHTVCKAKSLPRKKSVEQREREESEVYLPLFKGLWMKGAFWLLGKM